MNSAYKIYALSRLIKQQQLKRTRGVHPAAAHRRCPAPPSTCSPCTHFMPGKG